MRFAKLGRYTEKDPRGSFSICACERDCEFTFAEGGSIGEEVLFMLVVVVLVVILALAMFVRFLMLVIVDAVMPPVGLSSLREWPRREEGL